MTPPHRDLRPDEWRWRHALWSLPSLLLIAAQVRPVLGRCDRAVLGTLGGGDALLQSGILGWTVRHFWHPFTCMKLPIFFPAESALMSMDSLLGQALLVAPVAAVADPSPALLYNLAVVLTLLLTAASGAALWLASSSGQPAGRRAAGAGFCALLLLGAPFTTWQLGMLNQISPPWVVLLLAVLWRGWRRLVIGDDPRPWWWAAAACLVLQAAWGWYGFADAVFVAGTCAVAALWRAVRTGRTWALLRSLILPVAAALALVVALAWPYLALRSETPEYTRDVGAVSFYSAQVRFLGNPGPHRLAWADFTGDALPAAERARLNTDAVLHPGWIIAACALVGVWRWRRFTAEQRRFGLLVAGVGVVGMVMAFGESGGLPPGSGNRVLLPFGVLRELFMPFEAYRAPVRFVYLVAVALAWWGAAGMYGGDPRRSRRWHRGLVAAVWMLVWVESVPMAMLAVPVPVDGRSGRHPLPVTTERGAVLTLPAPHDESVEPATEALWLHRALATDHAVTGGLSGWVPPVSRQLRERLAACERGEGAVAELLHDLAAQGVIGAEVALNHAEPARVAFWCDALEARGLRGRPTAPGYRFYALEGSPVLTE